MESSCHERIVVRRIAEYHQLGAAQGILICRCLRCLQDNISHQPDRIHVDPGPGGAQIHRAAHPLGLCQRLRDGADQQFICLCHPFGNSCRIAADEIDAHFFGCTVHGLSKGHKVLCAFAGSAAHQGDGCHGNSFIHYRDAEILGNLISCLYQMAGKTGDLLINLPVHLLQVPIDAV